MRKSYQISGMHCSSCIDKITSTLNTLVKSVQVTVNPPRAVLEDDKIPDLNTLNQALTKAGNYMLKEEIKPIENNIGWFSNYYPLFLILTLISLASLAGAKNLDEWMLHFMAGFFIVFSFFKLLDLKGFSDAYRAYDLLAQLLPVYGLIYPFLELALGFAFLFVFQLRYTLYATIILMGFSSLGVIQALLKKQKIRCACLGTVLTLPMSTITLVEDLGMVIMAIFMIF